jgi:hypothetical protein
MDKLKPLSDSALRMDFEANVGLASHRAVALVEENPPGSDPLSEKSHRINDFLF